MDVVVAEIVEFDGVDKIGEYIEEELDEVVEDCPVNDTLECEAEAHHQSEQEYPLVYSLNEIVHDFFESILSLLVQKEQKALTRSGVDSDLLGSFSREWKRVVLGLVQSGDKIAFLVKASVQLLREGDCPIAVETMQNPLF
ncbi:hypothetical protein BDZ45DRAFT_720915 [Acephala macrosclerotiorum]|nr:hypothetical protein BDZ45DRAFT_720915 [Acephala macrosclerotiorum]